MRFILKKKSESNNLGKSAKNTLWQAFDKANLKLQHRCANWLERKTSHFTPLHWMAILFCFILVAGSCSIYLMVKSITGDSDKNISVTPIVKPTNLAPLKKPTELNTILSKTEFEKMIRFRSYIESMERDSATKATYDSIVAYRPGLLDSLRLIEHYYQLQLKK
ncbi:hypothetical protein ACHRV5_11105 [Flavobacterium sp. FlaQc-52]|uniref:hypothetical protein n=1 Tax=Flavobacterium sp. FlaQc-52 TaxID=3374185 RepID=UPI003757075D